MIKDLRALDGVNWFWRVHSYILQILELDEFEGFNSYILIHQDDVVNIILESGRVI